MIIGKGNKQRPANSSLTRMQRIYLREWLEIRGSDPGALFCYITRGGSPATTGSSFIAQSAALDLEEPYSRGEARSRGIKPLTWHDFRRTVISDIIGDSKQGGLVEAQKIAGAQLGGHNRQI